MDITASELALGKEKYTVIDIRPEDAFAFGHIDGAVNIPSALFNNCSDADSYRSLLAEYDIPADSVPVICCRIGVKSESIADALCDAGIRAYSLDGGYASWLCASLDDTERADKVEKSIQKKFHKVLWSRFAKAVLTYRLISPGDRIAVCISGGKDSMLMAKLFQEMKRHDKFPFELVFLVMDPGYSPENRAIIEANAKMLSVPITVFETDIFGSVYNVKNNPCYLCARMRRGHLYNKARELGCSKIALGHHFDDVIETNLMSMIYGGQVQTMLPRIRSANFPGMELIRPMYFIREADIKHWRDYNKLHFLQCACHFTENCSSCDQNGQTDSKRLEMKQLIAKLAAANPQIEQNIFRSMENINLHSVLSYKTDEGVHSFLDDLDNSGFSSTTL